MLITNLKSRAMILNCSQYSRLYFVTSKSITGLMISFYHVSFKITSTTPSYELLTESSQDF